jgi:hypothetical protein
VAWRWYEHGSSAKQISPITRSLSPRNAGATKMVCAYRLCSISYLRRAARHQRDQSQSAELEAWQDSRRYHSPMANPESSDCGSLMARRRYIHQGWREVLQARALVEGAAMLEKVPFEAPHLQSKRLLIESRWVSKPLAFASKLQPGRLNN